MKINVRKRERATEKESKRETELEEFGVSVQASSHHVR